MAIHSLAEGFVRQTYIGANGVHHAMFPINFDSTPTPGTNPNVTTKGGDIIALQGAYADFLDAYRAAFHTDVLFGLAEAYAVDPDTDERTFIYGWDAGALGSSASPTVEFGMATLTLKTIAGGILRIVQMEGITPVNIKLRPPFIADTGVDLLTDYLTSDDGIIIGRDDAYPFGAISLTCKTSDALRKRAGL
jgi:hypothetical protein